MSVPVVSFTQVPRGILEDVATEDSDGHPGQRFSKCVTWGQFGKEGRGGGLCIETIAHGQHSMDGAIFPTCYLLLLPWFGDSLQSSIAAASKVV